MKIGVVGLGTAGLPFAVNLATKHQVIGMDLNPDIVKSVNEKTYCGLEKGLNSGLKKANIKATTNLEDLTICDAVFLSLPSNEKDFSIIQKVISDLDKNGELDVVISSTIPVGFTRQEQRKCKNISLSYVPMRTFEGEAMSQFYRFPHIIGTFDEDTYLTLANIFNELGCKTISAIPPEKAELAKLFSNSYRQIQMAIANEFATICKEYDVDPLNVIEITNTDPFRNIRKPGLWGGYCLPKDTKMLINCTKESLPRLLMSSEMLRQEMILDKAEELYTHAKGGTIGIEGVCNKPIECAIADTRNSPILDIIKELKNKGTEVIFYDTTLSHEQLENIASEYQIKLAKNKSEVENCSVYAKFENHELKLIK